MIWPRSILIAATFIIAGTATAVAQPIAQSGPERVSLLEVFSSEGCSSCPPAEEWVSGLSDDQGLWKKFVPVVFHVDYWDYLGWKDRFASRDYTSRQRAYASEWASRSVYTPGFVLDGREWQGWYGQNGFKAPKGRSVGELSVEKLDADRWRIHFKPTKASGSGYTVHAALTVSGIVSDVRAGENAGRKLTHDFTVVDHKHAKMESRGDGSFEKELTLQIPHDKNGKVAVSAWVTETSSVEPIQAAGAYL